MAILLDTGRTLTAQARLRPTALGARDLDRAMTFAEWNARACRLANALLGLGLAKGDRVAVLAYNRVEWAEIYVAAAKAGLVVVPVNFRLVGPEVRQIVEDSGAAALMVEDALTDVIEGVRDTLAIPKGRFIHFGGARTPAGYRSYEGLIGAASDREPGINVLPDDPWCLMYTSGTTGRPKGAIRAHRSMAMIALVTGIELGLGRGDDALLVMPMCHANSLFFFTAFLHCGAAVTIFSRPGFEPELCLRTLGSTGATFTSLVPTHYSMMLDVPAAARGGSGFGRVGKLMISSAPARAATKRAVMEMFPRSGLFELYGSTEGGWVTMLHPDEQFDRLGTVGRETVGSAPIRMLDEAGREVPDGEPGELFSSGPCNFEGYWRLPGATAEAFRGDYLSVGDIALRDADGYIRLIDRKNNMIISGGENVYPSEVEAVLAEHPGVRDVAVIGLPDARWGERIEAVVVRRPGAALEAQALIEWSRGRLAGHKRPRGVRFIEQAGMPRNATGKILHRRLREMLNHRPDRGDPR